jgi:hypothetical protein
VARISEYAQALKAAGWSRVRIVTDHGWLLMPGGFELIKLPTSATKKGRCRLHGGATGSGAPPGERNGQFRHGERTKGAIAERLRFGALLKMLRAGL